MKHYELIQPFTRTTYQTTLQNVVTRSQGNTVTQTSQLLDDGLLDDGLVGARDQLDSIKMNTPDIFPDTFGPANADDVVVIGEDSPLIEMGDMLSSAQRAARTVQDTAAAEGIGDIELNQTSSRQLLDSVSNVLKNTKKAMTETTARGLNWYSRNVNKLPKNVYNNLREAGATEREIQNFVDSINIEGTYGDKTYIEEFTNQAYKVFNYDIKNGTIDLPVKFKGNNAAAEFNNVENQRVTELRTSQQRFDADTLDTFPRSADAGNQFSAAAQADTDALLGDSAPLRAITRRYTELLKNGDVIDYIVTDGSDIVTVKEGQLKNRQISREEFEEQAQKIIDEGDGWFDMEETDAGLYGGNEKSLKELNDEYKGALEDAADKINGFEESPNRKVTVDELDTWAEERGSFEDELTQDLLNRKSKFGQTLEGAAEELQASINYSMEVISNTINRTVGFVTGETTPIYNTVTPLVNNVEEYKSFGGDVALETEFMETLGQEKGLVKDIDAAVDVGETVGVIDTAVEAAAIGTGATAVGTITGWLALAGRASVAAAAGEEGEAAAEAIFVGAADYAYFTGVAGVFVLGTSLLVAATYDNLKTQWDVDHKKPPPQSPLD